jgi:Phosphodiester glycosidase
MRARLRSSTAASVLCALCVALATAQAPDRTPQPASSLGSPRDIARGVALYHVSDQNYLDPPAPVSIWLLRVDLAAADLEPVLANDEIMDTETVPETASRHGAIAAVNAGFFLLPSGDPAGIYKLHGQLVSDTRRPRGAVGIVRGGPTPRLIFGRVAATMRLRVRRRGRPDGDIEIAGVDTTRQLGKLTLFTPAYHTHTDTAPGGLEWVIQGRPLRVTGKPRMSGKTPIPKNGFVLSFGGPRPPVPLSTLQPGSLVDLETLYLPVEGQVADWSQARDIVGGAGLLLLDGKVVEDWTMEKFTAGFAETRHPRTLIGTHRDGSVWLVTVDGRQPALSHGMTLQELRDLSRRIGLTNALNLDGGGSTTMWAAGRILNSPSDATGPRKVSDSILVMRR